MQDNIMSMETQDNTEQNTEMIKMFLIFAYNVNRINKKTDVIEELIVLLVNICLIDSDDHEVETITEIIIKAEENEIFIVTNCQGRNEQLAKDIKKKEKTRYQARNSISFQGSNFQALDQIIFEGKMPPVYIFSH